MDTTSIIDRVAAVQLAISGVKRAYAPIPPASVTVTDLPAFLTVLGPLQVEGGFDGRWVKGPLRMQCLVAEATPEDDQNARRALALFDAALDAFCHDIGLGQRINVGLPRSGEEIPARIEHGGKAYIGFEMFLDMEIGESFEWS